MIKKLISVILAANFMFASASFAMQGNSSSSGSGDYPFLYETENGDPSGFLNTVAGLNYISPLFSICVIKLGNKFFIDRWKKEIDDAVTEELRELGRADVEVRLLVAKVIERFDNGIGENPRDFTLAYNCMDVLNFNKCEKCIKKFVQIVSKQCSNADERTRNQTKFYSFCEKTTLKAKGCERHKDAVLENPATRAKTTSEKVFTALFLNWNDPFHISSILYVLSTFSIPPIAAQYVDSDSKAGSTWGDWANISNCIVIPTVNVLHIIQCGLNHNRTKAKRLAEEYAKKLSEMQGIIEIAGLVIGEINNGIDCNEAKGFLKALIILHWPPAMVAHLIEKASAPNSDFSNLILLIEAEMKQKRILYCDDDMERAFKKESPKENSRGELVLPNNDESDDESSENGQDLKLKAKKVDNEDLEKGPEERKADEKTVRKIVKKEEHDLARVLDAFEI